MEKSSSPSSPSEPAAERPTARRLANLAPLSFSLGMSSRETNESIYAATPLRAHFAPQAAEDLVTAVRRYPFTAQVDLQQALDELFGNLADTRLIGVHATHLHETLSVGAILARSQYMPQIGPLNFEDIDTGDDVPQRCLKQGLWLAENDGVRFALVLARTRQFGEASGVQIELAVLPGEAGATLSQRILREIDLQVQAGRTYRGKILSLEADARTRAVRASVHRLRTVQREDVILPDATLALLDRNVTGFVRQREKLRSLGLSAKKGLLFHGAPGTGKTHTLHYLAAQLPGHTTLLITAGHVGLLPEYLRVARLLQPSLVVLEDVDLIARAREGMRSACEESLLNYLLNEMDGLREDAEMIFILTTNRPEDLEEAIAARPGRIDQAIEFPLPDDAGRTKLAHLYRAGLDIGDDLIAVIVERTRGCSGAFIKELMRRTAQYLLEDQASVVTARHVEAALEEMLFAGGLLNRKLLGFSGSQQ
jgi:hypothetical protein